MMSHTANNAAELHKSSNCSSVEVKESCQTCLSNSLPISDYYYLTPYFCAIMGRDKPTHTTHKENVCAFYHDNKLFKCASKSKKIIKDGDKICERIRKYASDTYDPSKARNPNGCCSKHKLALQKIDDEKDSKMKEQLILQLDSVVNPAHFDYTFMPDRFMENDTECKCPYCKIASVSCQTEGNTYSVSKPPNPGGRPSDPDQPSKPTLPPRISVPTCQRCGRQTGVGKNHPADCGVGDLLQNVAAKVNLDKKLKDLITSTNIKEKIADARASTSAGAAGAAGASGGAAKGMVKIATAAPGKFLTVKKMTPQDVKKQLFPQQTMHEGFQKLMVSGNCSQNQMKAVAKNIRSVHGRKSVECNIMEKLSAANKELARFFSVIELDLDPCGGPGGCEGHPSLIPGKVKRHVVYCHDLNGLIEYIKRERGHHALTKLMLKFGMDAGQDFFKVCLNIIKEEDDLSSPAQKKSASKHKYTYADIYANMFKDSGVNGLFVIAAVEKVSESYHNLKVILDLVGLQSAEIGDWINTDDCKLALIALGLGAVGSTFNCMFCECPHDLFNHPDFVHEGGDLRSFKGCQELAKQYQEAVEKSKQKKTKLSSAPWKNCEHPPLCLPSNGDEDVFVIDALAPGVSKKYTIFVE